MIRYLETYENGEDDDEWDERVDKSRHFMSGNWSH